MSTDGDCASAAGNLDHVVSMMRDGHEFCERGVTEDGIVWQADVCNIEVDVLGAVILLASEGDGKPDLA